jgi:DNA-binding GntR family transcriptional regulator
MKINRNELRNAEVVESLDQSVYDALFNAIMHGRLAPGTRLQEAILCEQFGVSRTVVRQALRRLSELQVIDIVANKGASVASPSPKQTLDVFAARRAIEGAIVRSVAQHIDVGGIEHLRQCLHAEHEAVQAQDHPRWVALAGSFHLALAKLSGNQVLHRMLTELMTRSTLIVAMYEAPGEAHYQHHEHTRLVELLALHDADGAVAEMDRHLQSLEAGLRLPQ